MDSNNIGAYCQSEESDFVTVSLPSPSVEILLPALLNSSMFYYISSDATDVSLDGTLQSTQYLKPSNNG